MPNVQNITGDIFKQNVSAIVNPVNCKGVMGNGLALLFKNRHPKMFEDYRRMCLGGQLRPGKLHTWEVAPNRWIINLPTKDAYWDANKQSVPSKLEDVAAGLEALVAFANAHNLKSVAMPALGCGKGGLKFADVQPLITAAAAKMPHTTVSIVLVPREQHVGINKNSASLASFTRSDVFER